MRTFPIKQLIKFAIIGSLAALTNMLIVILLVQSFAIHPLLANIVAFLIAFNVSYFGHCYWSFMPNNPQHFMMIPKFFLVATTSFILNEGLYSIFLIPCQLNYILALFLVLSIVPIFTFTMAKLWAFKTL